MHKLFSKIISSKKGRSFLFLPFFIAVFSCSSDPSRYGRVSPNGAVDKESFVFSVSDEFLKKNRSNNPDKKNPKISEGESELLTALLKQKKYCLNNKSVPLFTITSRQEKIYDMTFAHLIEENYNSRPVAPRMYFGECFK